MTAKQFFVRYRIFIILVCCNCILGLLYPAMGQASFEITKTSLLEMLAFIPPIFILLGLLDVWVNKETMMRFLGKGSGLKGASLAFALGAAAAGPLYAAFPVATIMLKKRASLFNVFVFVGAWSTAKIPLLTFEAASLGLHFAATRLCINIFGILAIAYIVEKTLKDAEQEKIYAHAEQDMA